VRQDRPRHASVLSPALFEPLADFPNQPILEDVAFCETLIKTTIPLLLSPPSSPMPVSS